MTTGNIIAAVFGVAALGLLGFLGYTVLHQKPAVVQSAGGHGVATVPASTLQNQVPLGQQITSTVDTVSNAFDSISGLLGSIKALQS